MDKIHRNERMSAMLKMLTDSPNRIITLSYFCERFGAAKSLLGFAEFEEPSTVHVNNFALRC